MTPDLQEWLTLSPAEQRAHVIASITSTARTCDLGAILLAVAGLVLVGIDALGWATAGVGFALVYAVVGELVWWRARVFAERDQP